MFQIRFGKSSSAHLVDGKGRYEAPVELYEHHHFNVSQEADKIDPRDFCSFKSQSDYPV